jgi:hypothetical protein
MGLLVETFDDGFFDGPVHPLDLTIGPRVVRLGEPVFDVVASVAGLLSELDSVVGQDRECGKARLSVGVTGTSHAVRLSALSTSCVTANLLVRSTATNM